MKKGRLEAFTDAVIAIIITILVLQLPTPHEVSLQAVWLLREPLLVYSISFVLLITYWHNHHHLLHMVDHVDGKALWANSALLFFLSLYPFASSWLGLNLWQFAPQLVFAILVLLADAAWAVLSRALAKVNTHKVEVQMYLNDFRKMKITLALNVVAVAVCFVAPFGALVINFVMTLMWLIPDRRIEKLLPVAVD
jgi:uncharacterized membrane protein